MRANIFVTSSRRFSCLSRKYLIWWRLLLWKGLKSHFTLGDFKFSANKDFLRLLPSLISQFDRIQTVCCLFRCEKWPLSISSTSFLKLLLAAVNPSKQSKEREAKQNFFPKNFIFFKWIFSLKCKFQAKLNIYYIYLLLITFKMFLRSLLVTCIYVENWLSTSRERNPTSGQVIRYPSMQCSTQLCAQWDMSTVPCRVEFSTQY